MNVDEVRAIVHNRFGEVDQLRDGIFKASQCRGDTPFSFWIFDCTQSIAFAGFDLQAYQDELLRNEFYRVSGSLQWNLYCCYLCDEDRLAGLKTSGLVAVIERDTTYARKYVRTPTMLRNDFASLTTIAVPAASGIPDDIAALWQRKLSDSRLAVIYSDLPYSETVRQVKSAEYVEDWDNNGSAMLQQSALRIEAIDAIDIHNFRHRPRQREFSFAACNLIHGVNGAGKTSLLEGIEAWMCGRNRRSPELSVPENCLKLKIRGKNEWLVGPERDSSLYRQRDHAWYGNFQARKNDLYANFARFSFFDADAAARFEILDDDREIERALSRLVLGESATKIAERMEKILPMLQKEVREVSRTIRNAQEAMKSAKEAIASLQVPTETRKRAYEKLTDHLQSAGWRADPPNDSADGCLVLLASLNEQKARVDAILAELPWLGSPSIANVEKERQALTVCTAVLQTVQQEAATLKRHQEKSASIAEAYGKVGELLQRCLTYVEAGAMGLLDSAGEQVRIEQRKKSLTAATEALASIDIKQFDGMAEASGDMAVRVQLDLEQHSENAAIARQKVASLELVHGRIETLLAEIHARAQQLLASAPATTACPVCGALYGEGELQKRLQHQATHAATPELQQAHSELANLQKQQERLSRVLRDLDKLISIGREALDLSAPDAEPVSKLVSSIMFLESGIAQCDIDISRLEHSRTQFQAKGFTATELQFLNGELSRLSQDVSIGDEAELRKQIQVMASKQKEAAEQVDGYIIALAAIEDKTQAVLAQYATHGDATIDTVKTRMAKISGIVERLGAITKMMAIDDVRPLTDIAVDLDALRLAVEGFVRLKQQVESVVQVITENEGKIVASIGTLDRERPVFERLRSAVATLEELQSEHNAESYMKSFFSDNLNQIRNLFCAMHAPREFSDIVWQQDGPLAIRAVRQSTNAVCSVAEMSSGQRNALALAIFLTMNKKITQAPSLILLDDPVAHVDDLNIISFLDCLRELMSGCNRQLFFATANAKTAHLFTRKFDYLGEDAFRSFRLEP